MQRGSGAEMKRGRRGRERDGGEGGWGGSVLAAESAARWHSVTPRERERVSQTAQVQVQRCPGQVSRPEADERVSVCCQRKGAFQTDECEEGDSDERMCSGPDEDDGVLTGFFFW